MTWRGLVQEFRLPFPPSANVYWRTTRRGITYVSADAKKFKEAAGWALRAQGVVCIEDDPVSLKLDVYFPRAAGDLSNRIKVLEDALNGIAYTDDAQVVHLDVTRYLIPPIPKRSGDKSTKREGFVLVTMQVISMPEYDPDVLGLLL